jgi:uncharacterized protein DUF1573
MTGICRRFTLLALAVVVCGCSKPRGFYVVPENKDLGVISSETRVAVAEFEVVNGSDRPVSITDIFPSCTCTTVTLAKNPIPSGESTILRAEAHLADRPGKQQMSVVFNTDIREFPNKRVSFEAWVPASGSRHRKIFLNSFYAEEPIHAEVPVSSFSQGVVELLKGTSDNDEAITTHFADASREPTLVVAGTAPDSVGSFAKKVEFRESFPDEPSLGEGIVELELTGEVVPRWTVPRELYAGFVSLGSDGGIVTLSIDRNFALAEKSAPVLNVSAVPKEEWLSVETKSVAKDKIELDARIDGEMLGKSGAVRSDLSLKVTYSDEKTESYSTAVCMFVEE